MPCKRSLSESAMKKGDPLVVKKGCEAAEPANQVFIKDFYIKKKLTLYNEFRKQAMSMLMKLKKKRHPGILNLQMGVKMRSPRCMFSLNHGYQ